AGGELDGECNERIAILGDELDPDPGAYVWGKAVGGDEHHPIRVVPPHRVCKLRPLDEHLLIFLRSRHATKRGVESAVKPSEPRERRHPRAGAGDRIAPYAHE